MRPDASILKMTVKEEAPAAAPGAELTKEQTLTREDKVFRPHKLDPCIRHADLGLPLSYIHEWLVDCHTYRALQFEFCLSVSLHHIIFLPGGESNHALLEQQKFLHLKKSIITALFRMKHQIVCFPHGISREPFMLSVTYW